MRQTELIAGLRSRNEEAFKVLVEKYKDTVYNLCFAYVKNASTAEDLAQEVFIEVFQHIGKFNEKSSLDTWIYRITINEALQVIRRQKAKKRWGYLTSLFGQEDKYGAYHKDEYHPGVSLENKERAHILFSQIDNLSDNQRTAFLLSKIEGKSYQEIADIMEMSISSVESLLHRAKTNLKKRLGAYYKTTLS